MVAVELDEKIEVAVQIPNIATGRVAYATTFDHGTMSVAVGTPSSTRFTIPSGIDPGPSRLFVTANGIALDPVPVTVK